MPFISVKRCLLIGLTLVVEFAGCSAHNAVKSIDRPNIILISLDTLRADRLHCYGYQNETSPAMDAMADGGVLFEKAYAQSAWTLPSHVSMFTSLYPSSHGVTTRKRKIPDNMTLLSEILKDHGYQTASFNGSLFVSARYGFGQGFDVYEEIPVRKGDASTICDRMLDWLEKKKDLPFFIFYHTYETHRPFSPPVSYRDAYVPSESFAREMAGLILRKVLNGEPLTREDIAFLKALRICRENETVFRWIKDSKVYDGKLSDREIKMKLVELLAMEHDLEDDILADWRKKKQGSPVYAYLMENYDAEILFTDHQIRRLLDLLTKLGLREKTLIVLTSDHGEEFSEHGGLGHGKTFYNEVIRVPMIFSFPGQLPEGLRIQTNAALIDLAPTILEIAGIEAPENYQGVSLLSCIKDGHNTQRLIFSENPQEGLPYRPVIAIDGGWKLHYDQTRKKPEELYNLREDPGEVDNLAGMNHAVEDRLRAEITRHLEGAEAANIVLTEQGDEIQRELKSLGYLDEEEKSN